MRFLLYVIFPRFNKFSKFSHIYFVVLCKGKAKNKKTLETVCELFYFHSQMAWKPRECWWRNTKQLILTKNFTKQVVNIIWCLTQSSRTAFSCINKNYTTEKHIKLKLLWVSTKWVSWYLLQFQQTSYGLFYEYYLLHIRCNYYRWYAI